MPREITYETRIKCVKCKAFTKSITPIIINKEAGNRYYISAICGAQRPDGSVCNYMKKKTINVTQVKYLSESIKSAADKTEHIIKSSDQRSLEEISVITDGITELQVQNSAVKTGGGPHSDPLLWPIKREFLNVTDPTGLAVPAIEAGEEVVNKIITFLPKLLTKAISGNGFENQEEVIGISNTLQQIQDKTITPEDGLNRLKGIERSLEQRKLDYRKDVPDLPERYGEALPVAALAPIIISLLPTIIEKVPDALDGIQRCLEKKVVFVAGVTT